ncbi:tRNA (adenine22-N1)-methyltransferase [Marinobacterium halophilum]|uniref:tRNA (Adenine22-N1)-methyltransferase n=1 Tax=Marinobacterium halophilum TaxID=267374 RepID=A0A2P8EQI0_9GAMM|nr:tRNA (adenine(22)-N(1))-methyltransferase TrmK [Marinobacterium halophilum]PSL11721.1 tRNA (adenine22-N1)-methyltransferase [Marinobacterium halophilum]
MKLSKRLQQILSMAEAGYTHIWDCCCDHGYLGAALLTEQRTACIHFVDVVPELIDALDTRLRQHYPTSLWQTHCMDMAQLPLEDHSGKHLVIIAGVGGELMTDCVDQIHRRHPHADIDYLLCPVYHPFRLRQLLIRHDFKRIEEALVQDKQRFYEILLVTGSAQADPTLPSVSTAGDHIWHADTPAQTRIAEQYLRRTLNHYQRVQQGRQKDVQHIIDAYRAVGIKGSAAANS